LDASTGLIVCRFAHFVALMLLFGSGALIALIAPASARQSAG